MPAAAGRVFYGNPVSELEYITVEAARLGRAEVACKGKRRTVFLPRQLSRRLMEHARRMGVKKGPLFLSRNGCPWADPISGR